MNELRFPAADCQFEDVNHPKQTLSSLRQLTIGNPLKLV